MLDEVDHGLIHALHIDGRAPFSRIAAVLDVSTQTVARRYRRLRDAAGLRVVGLADPAHAAHAQWLVRLTAGPQAAQDLARALARRADTSWVKLASGGTEIVAVVHAATSHALLLHDIPRTAAVTAVSAHHLLHMYLGGPTAWRGRTSTLSPAQRERLEPAFTGPGQALADSDGALLKALQRDGRASLGDLAAATGWAPATVARRLADLRAGGAVFFDVEVDDTLLGVTTQALLWMSVEPAHLDRVASTLAEHHELAFVAATTGPTNLVAQALCPDPASLHRYLTRRLGALETIRSLETAPVMQTVKAVGPAARLPPPGRGPAPGTPRSAR
ncbi:Lrp/AsnC family transcriptional regulator [Actinomadura yumaensis]|uniref:Lrp/AsnC family transcriptional regulator n=1 Tax=Actinomadura yumaensis TaxID=111807 RepID=A0ABW2CHQ7_9ACTN